MQGIKVGFVIVLIHVFIHIPFRVVILDEATASMDEETDLNIQKMIRDEFGGCTVLTIAHRLHTILDYDRVIVLEKGEVKEIGKPAELAADEASLFASMLASK